MKKIILFLSFLFVYFTSYSQQNTPYITVQGAHTYNPKKEYKVSNVISMTNIYQATRKTFEDYKAEYLEVLKAEGISTKNYIENSVGYALLNYQGNDGTILEFTSSSLEETEKFLNVHSTGVSKHESLVIMTSSDMEMTNNFEKAFRNAKNKATLKAKKIGRSIGKAIYINDTNTNKRTTSFYSSKEIDPIEYTITVSFELL